MTYEELSELCGLVSRPFSAGMFRILLAYRDISASEAASRLDLHIKTAQDFLEGLYARDLVYREEVMEGRRPYYRYRLRKKRLHMVFNLEELKENGTLSRWLHSRVREKANNGAVFSTGYRDDQISSLSLYTGEGRNKKEWKLNLTSIQGRFLFHLPFPNMDAMKVEEIMEKAGLRATDLDEIADLLGLMVRYGVIESSRE